MKPFPRSRSLLRQLAGDETAATLVEYAAMVAFVAAVVIVAVRVFGGSILSLFQMSGAAISAALS